ncbi:MAG: UDP-N-acetylmuramoyl-tripeptide--D-alanyl-D-alanine ligase [Candidatus Saccharibacteria bacterium]
MNASLETLAGEVGGELINADKTIKVTGASIDSRKIEPGVLFFALKGERSDGHDFVDQALSAGAAAAVVSRITGDGPQILVDDPLKALQKMAAFHRSRFDIPVIAVTGSVGKTTTKDLLAECLEGTFHTLKTSGNYNNEIGMPLTLLQLKPYHQACVVEMGMSALGEIDLLSRIARPTACIIVNVGPVHLENLGSIENIARAKCEVLEYTTEFAVLHGNSPKLREQAVFTKGPLYWFGEGPDCQWQVVDARIDTSGTSIDMKIDEMSLKIKLPLPASHLAPNAVAAVGTAIKLGVEPQAIIGRLRDFKPSSRRLNILPGRAGSVIIDDCYNANPQSMSAALRVLADMSTESRKIAVLGDMFELGDFEAEGHKLVGKAAADHKIDVLVTVGPKAALIAEGARNSGYEGEVLSFEDKSLALPAVLGMLKDGDVVLIKASRGMHMEELVEGLQGEVH